MMYRLLNLRMMISLLTDSKHKIESNIMAKRFFDSGKFDDPFYRKLPAELKCTYDYLQSKCDYAGILNIDIADLNFKIGCECITFEMIKEVFTDKLIILAEDARNNELTQLKIFLPRFIYWQYKNELTPNNSVHRCVYQRFKEEGIAIEPYLAQHVLKEDFEEWSELYKQLKDSGEKYKDYIKKRG